MAESIIGATLANLATATARSNFELQFNTLQNTLIRQFNEKVDDINARTGPKHQIDALQSESNKLLASVPIVEQYREGNINNTGQLEALSAEITELLATINTDATVDAAEVTAFEAKRDLVAARLENIYVFVHPDINDGDTILKLKEDVDSLKSLTAVAGTLSPDNDAVTSFLNTLKTKTDTALITTENTVATALDLEQKITAEFTNAQAELLDLTTVETEARNSEIEDLQIELGNLLRAVSLSFEVNADFASLVANSLSPTVPPPGSVLNLFT